MMHKLSDDPVTRTHSPIIQVMDMVNVIRQRWTLGLMVGLVAAFVAACAMLSKPPKYKSQATLVVDINSEKMIELQRVARNNETLVIYDTIIKSYLERLNSLSMANFMLENMTPQQLDVIKHAYPNAPSYTNKDGHEFPDVAVDLRKSISIIWKKDVQIISIQAIHSNSNVAYTTVQAYCNMFIHLLSSRMEKRTDQVLHFLQEQSEILQAKLEESEAELQQYRSDKNLVSIESRIDVSSRRLSRLDDALTQQRLDLIHARNRINQIEKVNNPEALLDIPFILNNSRVIEIQSALVTTQDERKILAETFGRRHPIMIENQTTINVYLHSLELAVNRVVTIARKELEALQTGYVELQNELKAAETEALTLDREAVSYRVLKRKHDIQKQIFDLVSSKFTSANISNQFDIANIHILDQATLPKAPFVNYAIKVLLATGMIFFVCFCGLPIGLEMIDNRLRSFVDIENYLGKPVFGNIQKFKNSTDLPHAVAQDDEGMRESFRSIYSSLKLHSACNPPLSLLITSSVPAESKTFVACKLAATFAHQNLKVLLLDCDLRHPSVHRCFKLSNDFGLIEWLNSEALQPSGSDIFDDAQMGITHISNNLYVLPSGGSTTQATEILDGKHFKSLMSYLKNRFDILIIDTPPVDLFLDAILIAEFADNTLLIAKQNGTIWHKVRSVVSRFEYTNAPVIGVVLNHIRNIFFAR